MTVPIHGADPFFDGTAPSDEAKIAQAREYRAAVRQMMQSSGVHIGQLVFRYGLLFFVAAIVTTPLLFGIRSLVHPDGPRIGDLLIAVTLAIALGIIPYALWRRNHRITMAMNSLGRALGGTSGTNRFSMVLDWLDAHWPAETPREVVDMMSPFERRWDLQMSYRGSPVLVVVQRRRGGPRSSIGNLPAVERMSFYVGGSNAASGHGSHAAPALRELEELGYWVKRTRAGVFVSHAGISLERLDPAHVTKVLDAARQFIAS
ncbi:MAG: hypothetical protein IPM54_39680 [Polyangiaceae bacterium]|nr:hypothetical protein [Polyangiaceae bacterium]